MNKTLISLAFLIMSTVAIGQEVSPCGSFIKDMDKATTEELTAEYQRLKSYENPFCDTTNSDFHKIMKTLAPKLVTAKSKSEAIIAAFGEPYFSGTLAEYENQKVSVGRDGKMIGTVLPPMYKVPPGEFYIVYLWRKKDYLIFALKGGTASASAWWEKGKY